MDYQKTTFKISPDNQDNRDILMASLAEVGYESFSELEQAVEAFIPIASFDQSLLDELHIPVAFQYDYQHDLIKDQNWNEEWEKNYFKPLLIANECLIRAPFHKEFPQARFEIVIEPKMAFGTGNHETTALMIEYILELKLSDLNVLDMGCGTGILAMLASMRNAQKILAIDIDEWAVESTKENILNNGCKNITVLQGDASILNDQKFDLIFANIHKNILIQDMPKYASVLNSNGTILLSGFYESDLSDIQSCALVNGFVQESVKTRNKWVTAKFVKAND